MHCLSSVFKWIARIIFSLKLKFGLNVVLNAILVEVLVIKCV